MYVCMCVWGVYMRVWKGELHSCVWVFVCSKRVSAFACAGMLIKNLCFSLCEVCVCALQIYVPNVCVLKCILIHPLFTPLQDCFMKIAYFTRAIKFMSQKNICNKFCLKFTLFWAHSICSSCKSLITLCYNKERFSDILLFNHIIQWWDMPQKPGSYSQHFLCNLQMFPIN